MAAVKRMKARYAGFKREFGSVKIDDAGLKDPNVEICCGEPDPRIWYFRADGRWYTVNIQDYLNETVFPELAEIIREDSGESA